MDSTERPKHVKSRLKDHFLRYRDNRLSRSTEHGDTTLRRKEARMTAAETGLRDDTELERVQAWRAGELERAGYPPAAAAKLAARQDVDLHLAIDLVRQGCSHEM